MRKKRFDKDVIVLLISTAVTIASWIGFDVYRVYTQMKIEPQVENYLRPINTSLKTDIFSKLEQMEP